MRPGAPSLRAFTLIELLVVSAVIALLVGILLPSLAAARRSARCLKCLSNVRSLEIAHTLYANANKECFIDVGLAHGGVGDETLSWVNTLNLYYDTPLAIMSPGDQSAYWPAEQGGQGILINGKARRTSYGVNNWLSRTFGPGVYPREPFDRFSKVQNPSATIQFLLMTEEGSFAVSDHVHAEGWDPGIPDAPPAIASGEVKTHAWGGRAKSWEAKSNFGFLDGHAETRSFRSVFTDRARNNFDPTVAH
ncbi:DUF1559 domain-containing protein [soil metagenome]